MLSTQKTADSNCLSKCCKEKKKKKVKKVCNAKKTNAPNLLFSLYCWNLEPSSVVHPWKISRLSWMGL